MTKTWNSHLFSWQICCFLLNVWTLIYYWSVDSSFCSLPFVLVCMCIFFFYLATEKHHMHLVCIHLPVCTSGTNYIRLSRDTPIDCKSWTHARGYSLTNCYGCCWSECSMHSRSFSAWARSFPQIYWLNCSFTKQDSVAFWDFKRKRERWFQLFQQNYSEELSLVCI